MAPPTSLSAADSDEISDPTHARAHAVDVEIVEGASDVSSDARIEEAAVTQKIRVSKPSNR
jgi:hypothetical protein